MGIFIIALIGALLGVGCKSKSSNSGTTSTQLSSTTIILGQSVTDTATVTVPVGPGATGTVDFQVSFNNSAWSTFSTKPLSGGTATSDSYTPAAAGSYYFRAIYSGDSNYASSQSTDNAEPLTVNPASSTTSLPLQITEPQDEITVNTPTIEVKGVTTADAVVTINGSLVDVDESGKFSTTVSLEEGPNCIEVVATDSQGNQASQVLTVIYVT